jgi:hypothetical protein
MHERLIDASNELADVEIETGKLVDALALIRNRPDMFTDTMGWLAVQGVASAIEKIYGGCERILVLISKQIDRYPIDKTGSWHRLLILRMSHPFGDTRPAVLSAESAETIDTLRAFRHRERNSYGSAIDFSRVIELADETILAPALLRADLERLSAFLQAK